MSTKHRATTSAMTVTVSVDTDLLKRAMRVIGAKTPADAAHQALRALIRDARANAVSNPPRRPKHPLDIAGEYRIDETRVREIELRMWRQGQDRD
jgi:Bacterial antitoxin of type II TA system, VapB